MGLRQAKSRESPAIAIIEALRQEGTEIVAFDPAGIERTKTVLGGRITSASSPYEACRGANAVVVLTDWPEFAELDLSQLRSALRHPIVIDGRNMFRSEDMKAAGFHYYSVGRPSEGEESVPLRYSLNQ